MQINLRSRCHQIWLACLVLVLGTLAIYWPARHYGFVDYDDNDYVFNNPTVRAGLSWWGLAWAIVDQHASNWHPLTWLSHMFDCQLFGLNAGPQHLMNVLFHCANAALLLLLLNSLTGAFWRSAVVAALFAWHPLRVESVAWISERKDVLSGFFFMLTLWMYALHVKKEIFPFPEKAEETLCSKFASPSRRLFFYKLSLGFFALGLLSKPMLVTAPLVLLLLDFWPLGRVAGCRLQVASSDSNKLATRNFQLVTGKWPFFLFSAVVGVIAFFAQRAGGATDSGPPMGIVSRMEDAIVGYSSYLEKFFWPQNLACLYLRPEQVNVSGLLVAVVVLIGISVFAMTNLHRRPYLIMGWLWFLVMLLPVSGLVQFGLQSTADHYTYLPSIGFYLMIVWGVAEWAEIFLPPAARRLLPGTGVAAVLAACALLSRHQLGYWQNTRTLMEHALKIDPDNYVAHDDLGVYFSKIGLTREALRQFQLERQTEPNFARRTASRSPRTPTAPE